ncbi:winged helix-turn-helix domain-containing protein [uncultured Methanomethylovorans sp.]|uniref:winged helix-turn-helix domain-containing protein n=1 Tax=uncultured Methanomethylovorans sp. TaxID=183759 RepID=UPI002AA66BF1|nr:winged helix-turn-helix domain-containing protein [uncultured Methanomethylovorans sp.]
MSEDSIKNSRKEWIENIKKEKGIVRNPTEDHDIGLKTLQNPVRRKILSFLAEADLNIEDIQNSFKVNRMQAKFHLDMLENALYIEKIDVNGNETYCLSPRGEAYLENVKTSNEKGQI